MVKNKFIPVHTVTSFYPTNDQPASEESKCMDQEKLVPLPETSMDTQKYLYLDVDPSAKAGTFCWKNYRACYHYGYVTKYATNLQWKIICGDGEVQTMKYKSKRTKKTSFHNNKILQKQKYFAKCRCQRWTEYWRSNTIEMWNNVRHSLILTRIWASSSEKHCSQNSFLAKEPGPRERLFLTWLDVISGSIITFKMQTIGHD